MEEVKRAGRLDIAGEGYIVRDGDLILLKLK
jgi:ribosome-binding ATPase YchF (GTP1/OBG family)